MARVRGIVMENRNGQAVILTQQGEFRRIVINKAIEVGELYHGSSIFSWKYALAAVVILAVTIIGALDFLSVKAYAQVSDSLELGVNRWSRVVTVRALDDQGTAMLEQTNLKGKKIDVVVEEIADQALVKEELEQEDKWKEFPLQASDKGNKDQEFVERVEQNMNKGLQKSIDKRKSNENHNDNHNDDSKNNSDKAVKKGQEKNENKNTNSKPKDD